jgi:hypothetical protein
MFDNIGSFVAPSRDNASVKRVHLYPFDTNAGNYEFWDKVGQIVGNIRELLTLSIQFNGDEARMPHWEILTRIGMIFRSV